MPQAKLPTRAAVATLAALACFTITGVSHAQCDPDEVGYVASFQVKPGNEAKFEAALSTLAATVMRVESGVILYAPYRGAEGKYYMLERYENAAAREAHGSAPEVAALFPSLGPHMEGAPDVQPVNAVCAK